MKKVIHPIEIYVPIHIHIFVMHVITIFFHGTSDENVFIPIRAHQDRIERRERHLGGVQQEKLFFVYDLITLFYDEYDGNIFIMI